MSHRSITDSTTFRAAIADYERALIERTGQPLYRPFVEQREALAQAVDGLDLAAAEWRTLRWLIDSDAVEQVASIIRKARVSAPAVTL